MKHHLTWVVVLFVLVLAVGNPVPETSKTEEPEYVFEWPDGAGPESASESESTATEEPEYVFGLPEVAGTGPADVLDFTESKEAQETGIQIPLTMDNNSYIETSIGDLLTELISGGGESEESSIIANIARLLGLPYTKKDSKQITTVNRKTGTIPDMPPVIITPKDKDSQSTGDTYIQTAGYGNAQDVTELAKAALQLLPLVKQSLIPPKLPNDCAALKGEGVNKSGQYTIKPQSAAEPFDVYCDMETDGGGWTVIQRRLDGSERFHRGWTSYKVGFGTLCEEFWLGNDKISLLTQARQQSLRVDMRTTEGETIYAAYDIFNVGSEQANYRLTVDVYAGTAGDAMATHSVMQFSTEDRDLDRKSSQNCAERYGGGWWYNACYECTLNGYYKKGDSSGVLWLKNKLATVEMKIRPADTGAK